MAETKDILQKVKELYDELLIQKKNEEVEVNLEYDMTNIKLISQKEPIEGHVLCDKEEFIQKIYINYLTSIVHKTKDFDIRNEQIIFISRIIEGTNNKALDIKEFLNSSQSLNEESIFDFAESIVGEIADAFILDTLIVSNILGQAEISLTNYCSSLISILKVEKDRVMGLIELARIVLVSNGDEVVWCNFDISNFRGYLNNRIIGTIAKSLEGAKNIKGRVCIKDIDIKGIEQKIDIESFSADEIYFNNCKFINTHGIISKNASKVLKFKSCTFNNLIDSLEAINCDMIDCIVENSNVEGCLVSVEKGDIINTAFKNSRSSIKDGGTYFININIGKIDSCAFDNCNIDSFFNLDKNHDDMGIIRATNSNIQNCKFKNCISHICTYRFSFFFTISIVSLLNSTIISSEFNNCFCYCKDADGKITAIEHFDWNTNPRVNSYIIRLTNSTECNNIFNECESKSYAKGQTQCNHMIGTIHDRVPIS